MLKAKSLAAFSLLIVLSLSGCGETGTVSTNLQPSQKDQIEVKSYKIGFIGPLSGNAASYGVEMQRILDYRLAEINKENQKNGYKIELDYEDGKCDEEVATSAFEKLTNIDNVKFIIGGFCSSESFAIAPMLQDKGVIAISAASSNPDIEGKSSNLFSISYSDALVGRGLADELGKYKKVALISEQSDFNDGIKKVVEQTLKDRFPQAEIVANEDFPKGETNFINQLEKIKNSGAEVLLLNPNPGITAENLLKQIGEIKNWEIKLISQVAYNGSDALKNASKVAENMILIDAPEINSTAFIKYRNKIISEKGPLDNLSTYYTASTLDALDLFSKLIAQYKGDPMQIQKALSTGTFEGNIGTITFGGKSFTQGIKISKFVIRDGKPEKE